MGKVSILVCTYSRDDFLRSALESMMQQTYENWEVLIVDNGNSEKTAALISELGENRFRYIAAERNLGECGGRNLALEHVAGAYVCYLDDDDLLPKDSLRSRVAFLESLPDCGMIYGDYKKFRISSGKKVWIDEDADGLVYWRKQYYDKLLERLEYRARDTFNLLKKFNFVRGGTPIIRMEAIAKVGGFDKEFQLLGDYEYWLRIAERYPIRYLPETVYEYRIHDDMISRTLGQTEVPKSNALMLCRKYGIRNSVQFNEFQDDIDRYWKLMMPEPMANESVFST